MFLDTSGFYCLYNADQSDHENALAHYASAARRVTTNYVLAEYVALADARGASRSEALEFSERIVDDPEIQIVWIQESLHRRAVRFLKGRGDKSYSLCDAAGFLVMRDSDLTEALTTDKHFEQEGFVRLLRP